MVLLFSLASLCGVMLSISVGLQWYACRRGCPLLQRCGMLLSVSDNLRVSLMASVIPSCLRWNNCHPFSASPVVWNAVSASAWCKDGSFLTGRDQLSEPASAIYDITPFSICIPTSFFFFSQQCAVVSSSSMGNNSLQPWNKQLSHERTAGVLLLSWNTCGYKQPPSAAH